MKVVLNAIKISAVMFANVCELLIGSELTILNYNYIVYRLHTNKI